MSIRTWDWHDTSFPARVLFLLQKGGENGISASDLLLLSVIADLTRPQASKPGRGCFAENATLGEVIGVHPTYIPKRLKRLNELGLVLIIEYAGRRHVECEWSRTAEERASLEGEYGDKYRDSYRRNEITLAQKCKPCTKVQAPPCTKVQAYIQGNKVIGREAATPPVSPANGHPRPATNGFYKPKLPVLDDDAKQARKELKEGLLRLGVEWEDNETVQSGTEHLVEVRKRDSNYRTVIKSFVSSYRKREQLQLPNISSCKQFRKHYVWIVSSLKKAGESVEEEMVNVWVPCGNGCKKMKKIPKSQCVIKE